MATPRKKPVRRTKVRTVENDDYTPLEKYCISINEYFKALRVAGFSEAIALSMIQSVESYPNWIIPDLPNKIDNIPYDDEDDD
jgi:DNA-binding XRE family transcriptional regulator